MRPRTQSRPRSRSSGGEEQVGSLDARLLTTAADLFSAQGYAGTSVDQIAATASAGKQSIYRRYPTKEALFKASVAYAYLAPMQRVWEAEVAELERMRAIQDRPLEVLRAMCRRTLDFVLRPDVVALYRLTVADGWRFPEWRAVVVGGSGTWERMMIDQLVRARDDGDIPDPDVERTSRVLVGLLTGWVLRQGVIGGPALDAEERDRFFECAWRIFTRGVAG